MTSEDFNKILDRLIEQDRKVGETKGKDYTIGSEDRLNNFKTVGQLVCCPHCQKPVGPRAVWGVYILKHVLAWLAWVKTGKVESEGLEGRAVDVRLYMPLGLGIAQEQQEKQDLFVAYEKQLAKQADRRLNVADRRHPQTPQTRKSQWRRNLKKAGRRHDDTDLSGWTR